VQSIAHSSQTGHATNIITGLSVGLESTGLPVIVISIAIISAYYLGEATGIADANGKLVAGLYATAVATMGMFASGVYVLSMSGFGPIADNAGGIAEMSNLNSNVRTATDKLDAAGNTTAAIGKGFAIGSACLVSLSLFGAYIVRVEEASDSSNFVVNVLDPLTFSGILVGAMIPYAFSALTMGAVGEAA